MTPARRRWRRLRRWLLTGVASVLVFAAAALALGRLAMPWLIDSPDRVATWLSERIGRSVALDGVKAHWSGPGPILELEGLRIAAAAGEPAAISLGRARVQIDLYAWLLPNRHLIRDFLLVDAEVGLVREISGRIALEGFGASTSVIGASDLASWLGRVGHLGLSGGRLSLSDRASGRVFELARVEMRVSQQDDRLLIGIEHRSESNSEARLRAVLDVEGPLQWPPREAQVYVEAEDFPMTELGFALQTLDIGVIRGSLQGQQWGSWRDHRLASVRGDWRVESLVVAAPEFAWQDNGSVVPNLHLPHAMLSLDGAASPQGFAVQVQAASGDDSRDGPIIHLEQRGESEQSTWHFAGERLPVKLLAALAQMAKPVDQALRGRVYTAQPQGMLETFSGQFGAGNWQVHGQLRDLAIRPAAARWPEFEGVDAQFAADAHGAAIFVDDSAVQFGMPGVLKDRIELTQLHARIGVHPAASGWQIEVADSQLVGKGFSAQLAVNLDLDRVIGPQLQMSAYVPEADIQAAKQFWVINKMPPRSIVWLNGALDGGRVVDGSVLFRGPLADWPFREHEGRFEARFDVDNATLDFHPDWPHAEHLDAEVAFINTSMVIDRATGTLLGNKVVRGHGAIPSLKDPVLDLDLAGEGDGADWLKFLKASPLQRSHANVLFGMTMTGAVDVGAKIHLPMRKDLGPNTVEGEALLKAVQYTDSKWDLDFTDVHGRIDFSQGGFSADQLRLKMAGEPGELALAVGDFTSIASLAVEAELRGRASAQALFGQYDQLSAILSQFVGVSNWQVNVEVPKSEKGRAAATSIVYATDLAGTSIGFPAPLAKPAETAKALKLSVQIPIESAPPLRLQIGDEVRLFARIGTKDRDFSGQLQFGNETPMDLPSKGLRVTGKVAALDPTAWAGWIFDSAAASDEDSILADLALDIGQGESAASVKLERAEATASAATTVFSTNPVPSAATGRPWLMQLTGPQAQGNVRFEAGVGRPSAVVAHFDHLYLPEPSGGGTGALSFAPELIPTLHLWVGDLRIGAASIGEARLEAFSTDTGLRVDLLEARSKDLEIFAKGDWISTAGGAKSRFDIRMTSEDLGRMLTGLGFDGVIEGGQTLARIDASWAGAPFDFALERLTGSIDVSVGRGRFLDVNPGAGRIFGLLSLRELPRRLTLDFRDLFQSGMSFDRIEGRFSLADGNAWTENLTVRGPAADILIIGRTGLASRDYDQQVMVAPHMSRVLPVIGGLAAGPVGAAAGFLAQGMVAQNEDIEKTSSVHYSVAGSWEKPVVARLTPIRPDAIPRRREAATESIRPG